MKSEEIIEELEKSRVSWGKVFLVTLFVLFTLIAIFFGATYIRWKAEISGKYQIVYTGQEEIKIDKLVDFYGNDLATELKENEALYVYCTSEYGKECIMPDFNNPLENNFREPLNVIFTLVLIDLLLLYILIKDGIRGKKRVYVYGSIIILYGLVILGSVVYKALDYYMLVKDGNKITANQEYYLRTDNTKKYIPVISYELGEEEKQYIPTDYAVKGTFEVKNVDVYHHDKKDIVTIKKDYLMYIWPSVVGILTFVLGIVYMLINKKKKEEEKK